MGYACEMDCGNNLEEQEEKPQPREYSDKRNLNLGQKL